MEADEGTLSSAARAELGRECNMETDGSGEPLYPAPRSVEDVVVAGVSCRLPEAESPEEFWQHLITGKDMVTEDDRRWPPGVNGLPKRNGKLKDLSRFDAEFFCVNPLQAHAMDPQLRILLEVVHEAMADAGVSDGGGTCKADRGRGHNTGVFVGSMFSEALETVGSSKRVGYGLTGAVGSMLANYVSFCFDFSGPSEMVNTSCSASLYAFHSAVQSIRNGECDNAIVAGTNVLLNSATAMHMQRLGMLSPEGACKAFDLDANGYVRSEGIVALYLTSRHKAIRSYLRVLAVGRSCDGYKPEGITYPSSSAQRKLIESTCSSAPSRIDPASIYYVEAHGTGTQAGDFEECRALDTAISATRLKRCQHDSTYTFQPLLVGSVKSNMGHCEPASGLAGIVKVILSFLHGIIPPNLHFEFPNPRIPSLIENRLTVVAEATPLPADAIVGLNSFGFGGSIAHAILQGEGDQPPAEMEKVCLAYPVSSRTPEGLEKLMDFVVAHHSNKDLLHLLSPPNHQESHRGYVLWNSGGQVEKFRCTSEIMKRPIWFLFAGMGTQWSGIGKDLLQYPTFARTVDECYRAVPSSVRNIITMGGPINLDSCSVVEEVTAICATTLSLYNLLKEVGISPDGLIGHSLGELAVCYADGCLTLEQCMQVAYWRVKCVIDAKVPAGAMGAVGLTWEEAKKRCPKGVWPCCNNATNNVTVSGRKEEVERFIAEIQNEGRFGKMVKSSGLAFHSPLMQPAVCQKTFEIMRKIIPKPKMQSPKWIVTSFSPEEQKEPILCSAEFHVTSLIKPVYFYEAIQKIPKDAVVIEVGPHSILQAILKSNLSHEKVILPLQDWRQADQSVVFMRAVGECHNIGVDSVNTLSLLQPANYPISPKTPNVSHLVAWDHTEEWFVPKSEDFCAETKLTALSPKRPLAPAKLNSLPINASCMDFKFHGFSALRSSYLLLQVWKAAAQLQEKQFTSFPVHFSDVTFDAAGEGNASSLSLHPISGSFEVSENGVLLVTGKVVELEKDVHLPGLSTTTMQSSEGFMLTKQDIYKELNLKGSEFSSQVQCLKSANLQATECLMEVMDTACPWLSRLDALFQMTFLNSDILSLPLSFCSLMINPEADLSSNGLRYDSTANEYKSAGVLLEGFKMCPIVRNHSLMARELLHEVQSELTSYVFLSHSEFDSNSHSHRTTLKILIDTVLENTYKRQPAILHVVKVEADSSFNDVASLVHMVCCILQFCCPVRDIHHDIIVIGEAENHISTQFKQCPPGNRGSVFWSDTLNSSTPLKLPYDLVVADNVGRSLEHCSKTGPHLLNQVTPTGFVLFRDTPEMGGSLISLKDSYKVLDDLNFRTVGYRSSLSEETETISRQRFLLYRKSSQKIDDSEVTFVHVQKSTTTWLPELQELLTHTGSSSRKRIYCISEYEASNPSGLIGMANCLKLEPYGDRLRCLYLLDTKWEVFRTTSTWDLIRENDLLINVVGGDKGYGSYRHIPLKEQKLLTTGHFHCNPDKVYIITGGLGGFGLELAEWLVNWGAKMIILTTRSGVKYNYQARKIERFKSQRVGLEVSKLDVSKESDVFELIKNVGGEGLGGVFHLANVLKDGLFESQSADSFDAVLKPKSVGAVNLDKVTRSLAPSARFVVFSSVVSGFGHPGLTNYAFANSAMERLCEQRQKDNLHALAIQWGPVGDVGILQETGKVKSIAGSIPKPICFYLDNLIAILSSGCSVVSCNFPEQLKSELPADTTDSSRPEKTDIRTSLCSILGFKRPGKLRLNATLSQLGVDSLLSFEVQQLLAGDYGLTMSTTELQSITVENLVEKTSSSPTRSTAPDKPMDVSRSSSGISLTTSDTLLSKNTDE